LRFQSKTSLTLQNFAEKLGYLSAQESDFKQTLKTLIFEGYVKLQQSGYMSHSKMHPKLITILKDFEADPFAMIAASRST
jgi:hypothetical protein